jgi:hypothetical protein
MPGLMAGAIAVTPGLMAEAIDVPTMRDRTAGDIAGHTAVRTVGTQADGLLTEGVRGIVEASLPAPVFLRARNEERERQDLGAE